MKFQRRQEELERRAQDLERREQELRNAPYNGKNSKYGLTYFKCLVPITSSAFSSSEQLAAGAIVLPLPAMLLPRHQCRHPRRVSKDRHISLLPVGR